MAIREVVEMYREEHGAYPPVESGLHAVVGDDDRSLSYLPVDPWGRDYVYERTTDSFRVVSYGADGAPGGNGMNTDIELRDGKLVK